MNTPASSNRSKNHRFPGEIISHGVWPYFRFCLSYRDVEELLFARGIIPVEGEHADPPPMQLYDRRRIMPTKSVVLVVAYDRTG
jgi:hypothetical protein